jgi:hypothetical protein
MSINNNIEEVVSVIYANWFGGRSTSPLMNAIRITQPPHLWDGLLVLVPVVFKFRDFSYRDCQVLLEASGVDPATHLGVICEAGKFFARRGLAKGRASRPITERKLTLPKW